jgi:hypothetical protein
MSVGSDNSLSQIEVTASTMMRLPRSVCGS